jgi:serine O-acetyltransferase
MIFGLIENRFLGGFWSVKLIHNKSKGFKKRILQSIHKAYQYETGSYLPLHTKIEGPINWPHGNFGVFISGDAVIGVNCTIFQHVTIGSNMLIDSKSLGAPCIGDNCILGAGAKIIGKITIGNNCRIGANCVVNENVPDNCTVVLGKPVIIQKENTINRIYLKSASGWGYSEHGKFVRETDKEILHKLENR